MAVTTVDIDEGLLERAAALLGTTTTEATVREALRELVSQRLQTSDLDAFAALDLWTPEP